MCLSRTAAKARIPRWSDGRHTPDRSIETNEAIRSFHWRVLAARITVVPEEKSRSTPDYGRYS